MADEARHHHYIPQGYLRGFAQKRGERQWYVHVNDLDKKRSYVTNVRNICGQRDFMRVDIEGHASDRVEKEMSVFEANCIEAVRRVAASGKFQEEDANLAMNLMALLAVRSPEMRENMRGFHEQVAKQIMSLFLATKERWEAQMDQMRAAGTRVNDALTYEDMKAFHEGGQYKITVKREFQMEMEFKAMETVLHELGKRLWTVYITDGKQGEFITTNRPLTLTYIDPTKVPRWMAHSPGFALPGTEIHFPLTRHAMLVGRWEKGGHVEEAQESFVAAMNGHMIQHSFGQVFAREKEIFYADSLCRLWLDDRVVERFTTAPTKAELKEFEEKWTHPAPDQ